MIHRNRGSNQKWRTREKEFKQQVGGISERCWKDSQGQPQGTTGGNFGQRARFFMLNWRLRFLTAPTAGAALRTSALRIDCAVVNILDFYLDSGQKMQDPQVCCSIFCPSRVLLLAILCFSGPTLEYCASEV